MTIRGKLHVAGKHIRERLKSPKKFHKKSFRTKVYPSGHKILTACPKGDWDAKHKRCSKPVQIQAILHPLTRGEAVKLSSNPSKPVAKAKAKSIRKKGIRARVVKMGAKGYEVFTDGMRKVRAKAKKFKEKVRKVRPRELRKNPRRHMYPRSAFPPWTRKNPSLMAMFKKEKQEHPKLSDQQVAQIVLDHLKAKGIDIRKLDVVGALQLEKNPKHRKNPLRGTCGHCGKAIPLGTMFCKKCDTAHKKHGMPRGSCGVCGESVPLGAMYCERHGESNKPKPCKYPVRANILKCPKGHRLLYHARGKSKTQKGIIVYRCPTCKKFYRQK